MSKSALARELGISRSSLYYKPKMPEKDEALRLEIEAVMRAHPSYGHRRVADELGINRKRALRVMNKFNLRPVRRCRTSRKLLDKNKSSINHPDITNKWSPVAENIVWTGDFTFIPFQGKHIYLAVVQDRYTAFVHGARVMTNHHRELVLETMIDALSSAGCVPQWFHSDQGSEYTSGEFENLLCSKGIKVSNSPKSSPWRNAAQESFFGRFKVEFEHPDCYQSLAELIEAIYRHIFYYNYERIHTRPRTTPHWFAKRLRNIESWQNLPRHRSYQQAPQH